MRQMTRMPGRIARSTYAVRPAISVDAISSFNPLAFVISSGDAGSRAARSSDFGISLGVFANLRCNFPRGGANGLSMQLYHIISNPLILIVIQTKNSYIKQRSKLSGNIKCFCMVKLFQR